MDIVGRYVLKRKWPKYFVKVLSHLFSDAENVIVANQEGSNSHNRGNYKFQYINGALEQTTKRNPDEPIILNSQGIREHVCDILEGGKLAFEKREQKYGFGK